ncbi:MAG: pyridoxal kinase [Pseudomonadota bacterium]
MRLPNIRVVVFSSHVARGAVGNRAIVFAMERLGIPVWAVPTVQLPWHPGHGPGTRIISASDEFASLVADLERQIDPRNPIAVISGYLGSADQAEPIARLVETARARGALVSYLCDPVVGDHGGLYVPVDVAHAIRNQLLPIADLATPNRFELSWLNASDEALTTAEAVEQANSLSPKAVLVTSAPSMMAGSVANLHISANGVLNVEHRVLASVPHGTGDLIASLFLAHTLLGRSVSQALGLASNSVYNLALRAVQSGATDFQLARDQGFFVMENGFPVRQIMTSKR